MKPSLFLQSCTSRLPRAAVLTFWAALLAWFPAGPALSQTTATPPAKNLPLPGEVWALEGHTCFLISPVGAPGKSAPWVWYAPTLPGLPDAAEKWMFERFVSNGVAVAGIDVGESYGNPAGRALFSAFHQELVRRGFSAKACLLARSRGGLMLYNWAVEHPESVACVAGIYPVCNLRSYPGLATAAGAYGMSAAELEAVLPQHNPVDRLAPLAQARVPVFHIHGDVDTLVPLQDNSGLLARRYAEQGGSVYLSIPHGQGHNMWEGFFHCEELVAFVLEHARTCQSR